MRTIRELWDSVPSASNGTRSHVGYGKSLRDARRHAPRSGCALRMPRTIAVVNLCAPYRGDSQDLSHSSESAEGASL